MINARLSDCPLYFKSYCKQCESITNIDTTFLDHIINESCMSLFIEKSELSSAVKIEDAVINELQTFESIFQLLCSNRSRIIAITTQDFYLCFSTEHYPRF